MNAIRKMNADESINKVTENKPNLSLISIENREDAAKMTKDYLNEKLSYFYEHGGPIMDI